MEQATFRNLILRDVEAANAEEAIRKVGQRFYDEGFVRGWDAAMVEASPNSISTEITGKKFDLIACVSPVYEDFGIPKVKAVGMLTGLSEDKVVDDCLKILEANA